MIKFDFTSHFITVLCLMVILVSTLIIINSSVNWIWGMGRALLCPRASSQYVTLLVITATKRYQWSTRLQYQFAKSDDIDAAAAGQRASELVCAHESFVLTLQLVDVLNHVQHPFQRRHNHRVTGFVLVVVVHYVLHTNTEQAMGQWVMGHGSTGQMGHFRGWSHGTWVGAFWPVTHYSINPAVSQW